MPSNDAPQIAAAGIVSLGRFIITPRRRFDLADIVGICRACPFGGHQGHSEAIAAGRGLFTVAPRVGLAARRSNA
jgi:hypothetical protein